MLQHDRVQWNGSVVNLGVGALAINNELKNPTGHSHFVNVNGLATLEDHLLHLWSSG